MHKQIAKNNITWLHIEDPDNQDINRIKELVKLDPLDVEDIFSKVQRPKIVQHPDYLFFVFHFPKYNHKTRAIKPEEVDVLLGRNFLITIHAGKMFTLRKFFKDCQRSPEDTKRCFNQGPAHLLYQATKELLNRSFPMLDYMSKDIDDIEKHMFAGQEKKMVEEISIAQCNILNFRRIFKPQRQVLDSLAKCKHTLLNHGMEKYFARLDETSERIWDILESLKETTATWQFTNNALISNKQNSIGQVITLFSFVAIPLLMIANLYTRSAPDMPGQGSPWAIWIIIGGLLVFILGALIMFVKRKWI